MTTSYEGKNRVEKLVPDIKDGMYLEDVCNLIADKIEAIIKERDQYKDRVESLEAQVAELKHQLRSHVW